MDMRHRRIVQILPFLVGSALLASGIGCQHKKPVDRLPYEGPTEPMAAVVSAINANNQRLPTIWARHDFRARVVDDRKKVHIVNGDGAILYAQPRGLKLVGKHVGVGTVFEIGSTEEHYWLKMVPEVDTMWWGHYRHLGKPCSQPIPIRPDLVLEVLGVGMVNTNFNELPVPTMRFNNEEHAYVFVWNVKLPDRWVAQKEIWYDVKTYRPRRVLLYDEDGRVVLRAELSDHQPVKLPNAPAGQPPPYVATEYRLRFPGTGTEMSFELYDVMPDNRGVISRGKGIVFNPDRAGVSNVIQLDETCAD